MNNKDSIESKYKIDCKDLFKSEEEFKAELLKVESLLNKIKKYKNNVCENENKLYSLLELDKNISVSLEKLYVYAHLNNDFDLDASKWNENFGKVLLLYNKYGALCSFVTPELLEKDYKYIKSLISKNPKLKEYELNLKETFRTKKHILSKEEETLLARLSPSFRVPSEVISKLTNVDLKFGFIKDEEGNEVQITNSNYSNYVQSKDENVRKSAFNAMYKALEGINASSAAILAGEVKNNNNLAKIRKYSSGLEKSLDANNVSTLIYDMLIKTVNKKLPVAHKMWGLYKDILGKDKLEIHDTYVDVIGALDKKYTFEEARDLIMSSLLIMGKDYSNVINDAFSNNWIDVYNYKNKRSGAYCTCAYAAHPYVLLNYEGKYQDVSTVTHELGHAMQYYYAQTNQTYTNYNYSIFVAEVASQVNEILLFKHMYSKATSKDEKLFLLDNNLKSFKSTIIRQTMFAEFEKDIHELDLKGNILTKELLNEKYYKLNKKYFGEHVDIDVQLKYEWSRIPHFFYKFYVYQYATGYAAALEIAENIWKRKEGALAKYLEFLKLGSTLDPVASLKVAGVDMASAKVYNNAFKVFENTINEFEKIYYSKEVN